jgi:hypothetical protein
VSSQQFAERQLATDKYISLDKMLLVRLGMLAEQQQVYQRRFEELRHK